MMNRLMSAEEHRRKYGQIPLADPNAPLNASLATASGPTLIAMRAAEGWRQDQAAGEQLNAGKLAAVALLGRIEQMATERLDALVRDHDAEIAADNAAMLPVVEAADLFFDISTDERANTEGFLSARDGLFAAVAEYRKHTGPAERLPLPRHHRIDR